MTSGGLEKKFIELRDKNYRKKQEILLWKAVLILRQKNSPNEKNEILHRDDIDVSKKEED